MIAQKAMERARQAAEILGKDPRVRLVFVFGSATDPARTPRDLDLALLSDPPMTFEEILRLRADLVAELGGGVDLVSLNDAPVILAHEVADTGVCLLRDSPATEVEFLTRARQRFWDFQPFLNAQLRWSAERQSERLRGHPS